MLMIMIMIMILTMMMMMMMMMVMIVMVVMIIQVELKMKSQLFYTAHQLVEAGPKKAVSWFAVGCYYHLLSKNDLAQRYFLKVCAKLGRRITAKNCVEGAEMSKDMKDMPLCLVPFRTVKMTTNIGSPIEVIFGVDFRVETIRVIMLTARVVRAKLLQ